MMQVSTSNLVRNHWIYSLHWPQTLICFFQLTKFHFSALLCSVLHSLILRNLYKCFLISSSAMMFLFCRIKHLFVPLPNWSVIGTAILYDLNQTFSSSSSSSSPHPLPPQKKKKSCCKLYNLFCFAFDIVISGWPFKFTWEGCGIRTPMIEYGRGILSLYWNFAQPHVTVT